MIKPAQGGLTCHVGMVAVDHLARLADDPYLDDHAASRPLLDRPVSRATQ